MSRGFLATRDVNVDRLFRRASLAPCAAAVGLFLAFSEARPEDVRYLDASDVRDRFSSAFAGISEWDAFVSHVSACRD